MKPKTLPLFVIIALAFCLRSSAQIYDTNNDVAEIFAGSPGTSGFLNAQGTQAVFAGPSGIAADSTGNLYVADTLNHLVRLISTNGIVSTFAGGGNGSLPGYGTQVSINAGMYQTLVDRSNVLWIVNNGGLIRIGTDTLVESLTFNGISSSSGLCVDSTNNLYYSTSTQIYRLGANGTLVLYAGSGNSGSVNGNGIFASFSAVRSLACDEAGNIYVWDSGNGLIRRIDNNQNVTTVSGNGGGNNVDGNGTSASFSTINSMQADNFGNLFLACGSCIRKIDALTNVWTIAGSFTQSSYANGAGAIARFSGASELCLSQGTIFVADTGNQVIRQISFNPQPRIVSAPNLSIANYSGISITGLLGRTYQIQSSADMNTWITSATLLLNSSPYMWIDLHPVRGNKFYRAVLLP